MNTKSVTVLDQIRSDRSSLIMMSGLALITLVTAAHRFFWSPFYFSFFIGTYFHMVDYFNILKKFPTKQITRYNYSRE